MQWRRKECNKEKLINMKLGRQTKMSKTKWNVREDIIYIRFDFFFFYTCSICQFAVSSKACKLSCLVVTALGERTTYTCRLQSPTVRCDLITGVESKYDAQIKMRYQKAILFVYTFWVMATLLKEVMCALSLSLKAQKYWVSFLSGFMSAFLMSYDNALMTSCLLSKKSF